MLRTLTLLFCCLLCGCDPEGAQKWGATNEPASLALLKQHRDKKVVQRYAFGTTCYVIETHVSKVEGEFIRVPKEVYDILQDGDYIGAKFAQIEATYPKVEKPPGQAPAELLPPVRLPRITRDQLTATVGRVTDKLADFGRDRYALVIERDGVRLRYETDANTYDSVDIGTQLPLK